MATRPKKKSTPRRGSLPYAAQRLNCSLPKVKDLIERGLLRVYRIGRHYKATDEQILKCIERLEDIAAGELRDLQTTDPTSVYNEVRPLFAPPPPAQGADK